MYVVPSSFILITCILLADKESVDEAVDEAVDQVIEHHHALEIPIALAGIAAKQDISMYDLVNALVNKGFIISWDDMNNPKAHLPGNDKEHLDHN